MVKIEKMLIEKDVPADNNSDEFKMCKKLVPNILDMLPTLPMYHVDFHFTDTNTELMNGIRRCLMSEVTVKCLTFDLEDFSCTDKYVLFDDFQLRLGALRISQDHEYEGNFSLNVHNKSQEIMVVYSKEIRSEEKLNMTDIISQNIPLTILREDERLIITKIKVKTGTGRTNSSDFAHVSNSRYCPIYDEQKVALSREYYKIVSMGLGFTPKNSVLNNKFSKFFMGYSTYRNYKNPLTPMIRALQSLIDRMKILHEELMKLPKQNEIYYSEIISIESDGSLINILFKDEQATLPKIITRYCFILTNENIAYVSQKVVHPEEEMGVIVIRHKEWYEIILRSFEEAIKDLTKILNAVKKESNDFKETKSSVVKKITTKPARETKTKSAKETKTKSAKETKTKSASKTSKSKPAK